MSPHSSSAPAISSEAPVATGFDFQALPNGDVLIQFFANDGQTINSQIITREGLARLPVVVHAFFLAVERGKDAASDFLNSVTGMGSASHGGDDKKPANRSGGDQ